MRVDIVRVDLVGLTPGNTYHMNDVRCGVYGGEVIEYRARLHH